MINEYASKNEVCHTMRIRANAKTVESLVRGFFMAFSAAIPGAFVYIRGIVRGTAGPPERLTEIIGEGASLQVVSRTATLAGA